MCLISGAGVGVARGVGLFDSGGFHIVQLSILQVGDHDYGDWLLAFARFTQKNDEANQLTAGELDDPPHGMPNSSNVAPTLPGDRPQ